MNKTNKQQQPVKHAANCPARQSTPQLAQLSQRGRRQERPQDFGSGVNAPLPPEARKI